MKRTALRTPCCGCKRVRDARNCNNAQCTLWQAWFSESWGHIRAYPRAQMDNTDQKPLGICVGGRYYLHPDQLRDYCQKNPCDGCHSPRDLCSTPCRAKKNWERIRKENGYELEK